jgi:signal transduction histidine kinase
MKKSMKSINPFKSVIQTSYDIIKLHGGKIKDGTEERKGAVFIIALPC